MQEFTLEIVIPHGEIFNDKVELVSLPGSEGVFEVLKGHVSTIAKLDAGVIRIKKSDSDIEEIIIDAGHAQVSENRVTVLADGAVFLGNKNTVTAQRIEAAKELLKSVSLESAAANSTLMKLDGR